MTELDASADDRGSVVALEHAVRRWQAETENAQRLGHRESGILTFVAAVLGLGVFRVEAFAGIQSFVGARLVVLLLVLALLATARALWKILLVKLSQETRGGGVAQVYASGHLKWPPALQLHPSELSSRNAMLLAYKLTTRAANSLHARNLSRKKSIDHGGCPPAREI